MGREMIYFTHYLVMYDCSDSKRCNRLNRILRGYCFQQQYSIFEGELTFKQIKELKTKVKEVINPKKDNIIIYPLGKENIFNKQVLGTLHYRIQRIF